MFSRKPLYLLLIVLLALSTAGFAPATSAGPTGADLVAGEILVQFQPGTPGETVAAVHRQNGGQDEDVIPGIDVHVVKVPAGQERARAEAYGRNPNVIFAEVNGLYKADGQYSTAPNDPLFGSQWQYGNIQAVGAWKVTTGSSGVLVAILDTGIDASHPDLFGKVVALKNFTKSSTTDDKYGHGTHVAGSVAANTNNGIGVAGTCPDCSLMNGKVLGDNGSGSWSGIAAGINWAVDNGAKVINMSLGGSSGSSTIETAVNRAWNSGVVVVASAGNSNTSSYSYPAAYGNVIAVAATDSSDKRASFSNYGNWVDVSAPGVSILSTAPDHRSSIWRQPVTYGTLSGTSMASPHVAGLAGLVWSTGAASAQAVRDRIESTADGGTNTGSVNGRINACQAVGGSCQ